MKLRIPQTENTRLGNTHKAYSHLASKRVAGRPINQGCAADVVDVSTSASCWRIHQTPAHNLPPLPPVQNPVQEGPACMEITF